MSVINVDFRLRSKINVDSPLPYNDLISLVQKLVMENKGSVARTLVENQLKISSVDADCLIIAIMLDHIGNGRNIT